MPSVGTRSRKTHFEITPESTQMQYEVDMQRSNRVRGLDPVAALRMWTHDFVGVLDLKPRLAMGK